MSCCFQPSLGPSVPLAALPAPLLPVVHLQVTSSVSLDSLASSPRPLQGQSPKLPYELPPHCLLQEASSDLIELTSNSSPLEPSAAGNRPDLMLSLGCESLSRVESGCLYLLNSGEVESV